MPLVGGVVALMIVMVVMIGWSGYDCGLKVRTAHSIDMTNDDGEATAVEGGGKGCIGGGEVNEATHWRRRYR